MYEKSEIVEQLKNRVVQVTFTKKDGTQRQMVATLIEEYLPPMDISSGSSTRKDNPDVVNVWDLDKSDWRSFRIDSVTDFKVVTY